MIKFMLISVEHNASDNWVQIIESDIGSIEQAEETRSDVLKHSRRFGGRLTSPDNIQIVQYRE